MEHGRARRRCRHPGRPPPGSACRSRSRRPASASPASAASVCAAVTSARLAASPRHPAAIGPATDSSKPASPRTDTRSCSSKREHQGLQVVEPVGPRDRRTRRNTFSFACALKRQPGRSSAGSCAPSRRDPFGDRRERPSESCSARAFGCTPAAARSGVGIRAGESPAAAVRCASSCGARRSPRPPRARAGPAPPSTGGAASRSSRTTDRGHPGPRPEHLGGTRRTTDAPRPVGDPHADRAVGRRAGRRPPAARPPRAAPSPRTSSPPARPRASSAPAGTEMLYGRFAQSVQGPLGRPGARRSSRCASRRLEDGRRRAAPAVTSLEGGHQRAVELHRQHAGARGGQGERERPQPGARSRPRAIRARPPRRPRWRARGWGRSGSSVRAPSWGGCRGGRPVRGRRRHPGRPRSLTS